MKMYPLVGEIYEVKPQGKCGLCGEIKLNGQRPNQRIVIHHDIFRGNDTVHKAHTKCIGVLTMNEIAQKLSGGSEK